MKYWDTSALVPLIIDQGSSDLVGKIADSDVDKSFWWGARVECASALAKLEREGVPQKKISRAFEDLEEILSAGSEMQPSEPLRDTAIRFLRVHPLRAADALQLAAAFHASEGHPPSLEFVCLDDRLSLAAAKEGFRVLP